MADLKPGCPGEQHLLPQVLRNVKFTYFFSRLRLPSLREAPEGPLEQPLEGSGARASRSARPGAGSPNLDQTLASRQPPGADAVWRSLLISSHGCTCAEMRSMQVSRGDIFPNLGALGVTVAAPSPPSLLFPWDRNQRVDTHFGDGPGELLA